MVCEIQPLQEVRCKCEKAKRSILRTSAFASRNLCRRCDLSYVDRNRKQQRRCYPVYVLPTARRFRSVEKRRQSPCAVNQCRRSCCEDKQVASHEVPYFK